MSVHNGPNVIENGLVLCLDAGDPRSYSGSGTVWTDRSGLGNNGTLAGGVGYNSANRGSLVFDGIDDRVIITGTQTLTSTTLICWLMPNGTQRSYTGIMHSRGGVNGNVTGMNYNSSGNQLGYHWNDSSTTFLWNSGLIIPNNIWSFCALSVTSSQAIAYLYNSSGQFSATNNTSHTSSTISDLSIGQDTAFIPNRRFIGNIAQSFLYNRALSADEIRQNFEATRSRFGI